VKILFVYPRFVKYLESFPEISFEGAERLNGYAYPPALAIPVLMSVTPDEHQCEFVDQNVEEVDYDTDADVIAVSYFTPQAAAAHQICKRFREKKKTVVVGGMHPTVRPLEAQTHSDIVCLGEGEMVWPQILEAIEKDDYQKTYRQSQPTDLDAVPLPVRAIGHARSELYGIHLDYLELSRGCHGTCNACVVPRVSGRELRFKRIDKAVEEIHGMRFPMCFIADDILFIQQDARIRSYLLELFGELAKADHGHGIFAPSVPIHPVAPTLLKAMRQAGVTVSYSTFGFDPVSNSVIVGSSSRLRRMLVDRIKAIHDAGMLFYAAFHLGFDEHTPAIKDNILEFCHDAEIKLAQFCLKTPWPGTEMWDTLEHQGRILHTDWRLYNGANVVFAPKNISAEQLGTVFVDLWQEFSAAFHQLNQLQRTQVVDYDSLS